MFQVRFGYSSPMQRNYKVSMTGASTFELRDASSNLVATFTEVQQFELPPFQGPDFSFFSMKIVNSHGAKNTVLFLIENSTPTSTAIAAVYHPSLRGQGVWASRGADLGGTAGSAGGFNITLSASQVFNNARKLSRNGNVIELTESNGTPVATLAGSFATRDSVEYFLGTVTDNGFTYPVLLFFDKFGRRIVGLVKDHQKDPPNMAVFGGESDGTAGGGGVS